MEKNFLNPPATEDSEDGISIEKGSEDEVVLRTVLVKDIFNQHQFDDPHALDVHLLTKVSPYSAADLNDMDYIKDIAPMLSEMEEQLSVRGDLQEDEDTGEFVLELSLPIQVGTTKITTIRLVRPTMKNLRAPNSRQRGEVRRNVQVIQQLSGLTPKVVRNMSVADYLTVVEQFQVWRDGR